ncbi:MAG TPA: DUF2510 domain-containing protein [Actinomycetota bacterium]|nr:DUF2510 domain-containing protein [Actinomycetota bacterium]
MAGTARGPAPGWYLNPTGGPGMRYWDGSRWGAEWNGPAPGVDIKSSGQEPPGRWGPMMDTMFNRMGQDLSGTQAGKGPAWTGSSGGRQVAYQPTGSGRTRAAVGPVLAGCLGILLFAVGIVNAVLSLLSSSHRGLPAWFLLALAGAALGAAGGFSIRYQRARAATANPLGPPSGTPIDLPSGLGQRSPGGPPPSS